MELPDVVAEANSQSGRLAESRRPRRGWTGRAVIAGSVVLVCCLIWWIVSTDSDATSRSGRSGALAPANAGTPNHGGAVSRKVALKLSRPGLIRGRLVPASELDEVRIFVLREREPDDAPVGPQTSVRNKVDQQWRSRFQFPRNADTVAELPTSARVTGERFLIQLREEDARAFAHRPAEIVLESGDATARAAFFVPAPGDIRELGVLSLSAPKRVRGIVSGDDGTPVPGALVYLRRGGVGVVIDGEQAETAVAEADSSGQFAILLDAPAAALVVRAAGYLPTVIPWVSARSDADNPIRVTMSRARTVVRGTLVVRGFEWTACETAIVGTAVEGHRRAIGFKVRDEGQFECRGVGAGAYRVRVRTAATSFTTHPFRVDREDVDLGSILLDLRGRVLLRDRLGALSDGDKLSIYADADEDTVEGMWSMQSTVEVGNARPIPWTQLPIGATLRYVVVTAPSRLGSQRSVLQYPGVLSESPLALDLEFAPLDDSSSQLRIYERDAAGRLRPLRLAAYEARGDSTPTSSAGGVPAPRGSSGQPTAWSVRGVTSEAGELSLPIASGERFLLTVRDPVSEDRLFWRGSVADTNKGAIVFDVGGCHLVVTLKDSRGEGIAGSFVQLIGKPGPRRHGDSVAGMVVRAAWTDDSGSAALGRVPPGWRFQVQYRDSREGGLHFQYAGTIDVPADAGERFATDVLLAGFQVQGQARFADGRVAAGRKLTVYRERPGKRPLAVSGAVVTSASGRWSIAGIGAGTYRVALKTRPGEGGEQFWSQPIEVTEDRTEFQLEFAG